VAERNKGMSLLEIWQNKIRALRRYLSGWAKNMNGAYKKEKKDITNKLDELDKKAESTMLLPHERISQLEDGGQIIRGEE
jgi:hypothetical protein